MTSCDCVCLKEMRYCLQVEEMANCAFDFVNLTRGYYFYILIFFICFYEGDK